MRYRHLALVVVIVGFLSALSAESMARRRPAPVQATAYKNITVLQDLSAVEMLRVMEAFNSALGVDCTHCHVIGRGPGLASAALDDKPQKDVARRMITMTRDLKRSGLRVECVTCHAGQPVPSQRAACDGSGSRARGDPLRRSRARDGAPEVGRAPAARCGGSRADPARASQRGRGVREVRTSHRRAGGHRRFDVPCRDGHDRSRERADDEGGVEAEGAEQDRRLSRRRRARCNGRSSTAPCTGGATARTQGRSRPTTGQASRWSNASSGRCACAPQYAGAVVSPEPRRLDGRPVYVVKGAVRDSAFSDVSVLRCGNGIAAAARDLRADVVRPGRTSTRTFPTTGP